MWFPVLNPFHPSNWTPKDCYFFFPWSHGHGKFRFPGDGQVLVLACEHAAPLPEDSLESLVQLCRSLWDATVESTPDEDVWKTHPTSTVCSWSDRWPSLKFNSLGKLLAKLRSFTCPWVCLKFLGIRSVYSSAMCVFSHRIKKCMAPTPKDSRDFCYPEPHVPSFMSFLETCIKALKDLLKEAHHITQGGIFIGAKRPPYVNLKPQTGENP